MVVSINMDSTYNGVHNIGLMSQKQNFLLISLALAIVGVGLLVFRSRNDVSALSASGNRVSAGNGGTRPCPFCAEQIKTAAIICRFCNRGVEPEGVSGEASIKMRQGEDPPEHQKTARHLAQIEELFICIRMKVLSARLPNIIATFAIAAGRALLGNMIVLGIFSLTLGALFLVWFVILAKTPDADVLLYRIKECAAMILAGIGIIWCSRPSKSMTNGPTKFVRTLTFSQDVNHTSILVYKVFGVPVDLLVLGACLVLFTWWLHGYDLLGIAYVSALVSIGYAVYIKVYVNSRAGYTLAIFALLYLFYRHIWFSGLDYMFDRLDDALRGTPAISIMPYLLVLIISAAVPHTRLIQFGRFKFGTFRGDLLLTIWRREIFVPLISALIACVLIFGFASTIHNLYELFV